MKRGDTDPMPTPPAERLLALDVARGFALFGILVVNMGFFSHPILYAEYLGIQWWTHPLDVAAQWIIHVVFEVKFISLFSFLFGIGFMLFIERAEQRGDATQLYVRRLILLFLFGLAHMLFIWYGDVLAMYAVLGSFLLLFRHRSAQSARRWAIGCLLVPFLVYVLAGTTPAADVGDVPSQGEYDAAIEAQHETSARVYAEGTWREIFAVRLVDIAFTLQGAILTLPTVLGMFLLGVYVWKRHQLQERNDRLAWARGVWWQTLALGGTLTAASVYASSVSQGADSPGALLSHGMLILAGPALAVFYFASIILLLENPAWRRRLAALQPLGRMALTNYLLQSLVATTVFYGYGLGWYGRVGPALGLGVSVIIVTLQTLGSRWWLTRYAFGPLEWLWRWGTYGARAVAPVQARGPR